MQAGTDLAERLDRLGKKDVVVVGYLAHICVAATVAAAGSRSLPEQGVVVVRDCVGDRDIPGFPAEEVVEIQLAMLEDVWCTVLESREVKG